MISITFVEQPESASTRHHHTVHHARAAAALPSVIGGPGSDLTRQPVYKVAATVPASEVWIALYRSVYRKSARVLWPNKVPRERVADPILQHPIGPNPSWGSITAGLDRILS